MVATAERSATRLQRDFAALRSDFPALQQLVHGKPLAYLDNAASSQSPTAVLEAIALQQRLTPFERASRRAPAERALDGRLRGRAREGSPLHQRRRRRRRSFSRAARRSRSTWSPRASASDSRAGDEVLITWLEHHSNIVPWQLLCERTGARLVVSPDSRRRLARRRRVRATAQRADEDRRAGARLERARHVESRRRAHRPRRTPRAPSCSSTARRPCRTCASTCRRSIATSTHFRATRCSGRRAPACCTASARCSRRCRPIKAAAT